jgi:maltooligosyltrehalose trehalohydrolase
LTSFTQDIFDDSPTHIVAEITRAVRRAATGRRTIVIAENEPQQSKYVQAPERGGYGLDGLWNDDFHHTAMVALTGHNDAYYTDYRGSPQELLSAMKYGYLYQGQWYTWQQKRRGSPCLGMKPSAFVTYIQNHDQVANSADRRWPPGPPAIFPWCLSSHHSRIFAWARNTDAVSGAGVRSINSLLVLRGRT